MELWNSVLRVFIATNAPRSRNFLSTCAKRTIREFQADSNPSLLPEVLCPDKKRTIGSAVKSRTLARLAGKNNRAETPAERHMLQEIDPIRKLSPHRRLAPPLMFSNGNKKRGPRESVLPGKKIANSQLKPRKTSMTDYDFWPILL
jgi:hypothetical protein